MVRYGSKKYELFEKPALEKLNNLLFFLRSEYLEFYNPKNSVITFDITSDLGKLRVTIAKALDPTNTSRASKGEKRYDRENGVAFAISLIEAVDLIKAIPKILDGSYVHPKEQNPTFSGCFSLVHFKEFNGAKKPSRITFEKPKGEYQNEKSLRICIIPPKEENKPSANYILRQNEFELFVRMLNSFINYTPYTRAVYNALVASFRQGLYSAMGYKNVQQSDDNNGYVEDDPFYQQKQQQQQKPSNNFPQEDFDNFFPETDLTTFNSPPENVSTQELEELF